MRLLVVAGLLAALGMLPASASAVPVAGRTAVLFIGGLGSTYARTERLFGPLQQALVAQRGYAEDDFSIFGGTTCAPLQTSEDRLRDTIASLKRAGARTVVLVGHSLGGVLAYDVAAAAEDDFVSGVVVVGSPLGGVSGWRANLVQRVEQATGLDCPAVDDLRQRGASPDWQAQLTWSATELASRSVDLVVVTNASDEVVPLASQTISGLPTRTLPGAGLSHAGALTSPEGAGQIASWIARQA